VTRFGNRAYEGDTNSKDEDATTRLQGRLSAGIFPLQDDIFKADLRLPLNVRAGKAIE
jgi:hypothetical protein